MPEPGIGLISDSHLQRHMMQSAISAVGFGIALSTEPDRLNQSFLGGQTGVLAWVVILTDEDRWEDNLAELIEHANAPVLYGLDAAPGKQSREYQQWERRLIGKLRELLKLPGKASGTEPPIDNSSAEPEPQAAVETRHNLLQLPVHVTPRSPEDPVDRVIVLAASLGGPAAVKEFLDRMPAGLPAAFVYAQHIDDKAANVLLRVLGRHSTLSMTEARDGATLRNGEIVIIPVDHEISFNDDGRLVFHTNPWPGPYGPSINQVILNVADYYRARTFVILFSGMGNDGAVAGPLVKLYGNVVWTQSSDSCVISSMPDAVAATGCVDFRGTPSQLAEKLIATIAAEEKGGVRHASS